MLPSPQISGYRNAIRIKRIPLQRFVESRNQLVWNWVVVVEAFSSSRISAG